MRHRNLARVAVLASAIAIAAPAAHAQDHLETADLLARGVAAYDRLPARVTLRDAPVFSEALGYLYAYQQRALRGSDRVDPGAETALNWLLTNMAAMKAGKADAMRQDAELRDRGMMMVDKAKRSDQQGKIWDVPAFLSSSANLFAYLQVARSPEERAKKAHQWLVDSQSRLVTAGVAADGMVNPEGWLPSGRRPGAKPSRVGPRAVAAAHAGVGSRAGSAATSDVVGGRAPRDTAPPPAPAPSDSVQPVHDRGHEAEVDSAAKLFLQGRLRETRDLARGWLAANPGDGDAHMTLAMVYAKASGKGTTPEDGAVRWLAIDHLTIAVKTRAIAYDLGRQMLQDLESRTPTADDLASRGWIPGQRLRVSFAPYEWIDEETTIRPRTQ